MAGTLHVAIVMDGNGRWAAARGLPRWAGHEAGADSVRRVAEAAPGLGIRTLTLYAFSSDNWGRPPEEVEALFALLQSFLRSETPTCLEKSVRLTVIGRRDRLPLALRRAIADAEAATAGGTVLDLRLAVDYSGRDAIVEAAARLLRDREPSREEPSREEFARLLGEAAGAREPSPDVDLFVRAGGEQRLSDFLLWECAYAELVFTPTLWPDFAAADLEAAVAEFHRRERRFGRLPGRIRAS